MQETTGYVDLRSDTVTKPTMAMRSAMSTAEVGDDGYREDPTVRRLEETYAELVGKEAALFVVSGTMANQIALRTWTAPGTMVIAGRSQHLLRHERVGSARNAQVQILPLADASGTICPVELAQEIELLKHEGNKVSLTCIENTHMAAGGSAWRLASLDQIREASKGIPLHMDGARLFNACTAMGLDPKEYALRVDSIASCVSKGLCAPVGSLLAGTREFIEAAWEERAVLGGNMRQAGVLAAAGLVALLEMRERLGEDHERARRLALGVLDRYGEKSIDIASVTTNIVIFSHPNPTVLLDHLRGDGVLAGFLGPNSVRLVTHNDIDDQGIESALRSILRAP